jgi:hypothetical protein
MVMPREEISEARERVSRYRQQLMDYVVPSVAPESPPLESLDWDNIEAIGYDDNEDWRDEEVMPYDEPSAKDFPAHELPKWNMNERDNAANIWSRQMDYRLRWIFYREEREGVNRQRYISPFSPDDFKQRVEKTSEPHPANTPTSTFYDWKIGGSDFLVRLESFNLKGRECLRCHFIYKLNSKELCYQDRVWDGGVYREINVTWADCE